MPDIAAQAGIAGRAIDLHGEPWRTEPRRSGGGQAEARAACCPSCAEYDKWVCPSCARRNRWVYAMGGYAGRPYLELCAEARRTAGRDGEQQYLDMCMKRDEERSIELANARSAREASRRADAAAAACLRQSAEIQLAMDELRTHPAVAAVLEGSAGPDLTRAEIESGLRTAMGLTAREPTPYQASMPPVDDLAHAIGLR